MRKSELDRLLLTAVAEALGQPVPKQKRQSRPYVASKRIVHRFRSGATEHHVNA